MIVSEMDAAAKFRSSAGLDPGPASLTDHPVPVLMMFFRQRLPHEFSLRCFEASLDRRLHEILVRALGLALLMRFVAPVDGVHRLLKVGITRSPSAESLVVLHESHLNLPADRAFAALCYPILYGARTTFETLPIPLIPACPRVKQPAPRHGLHALPFGRIGIGEVSSHVAKLMMSRRVVEPPVACVAPGAASVGKMVA